MFNNILGISPSTRGTVSFSGSLLHGVTMKENLSYMSCKEQFTQQYEINSFWLFIYIKHASIISKNHILL
jgi:hypothetical protein